MNPNPLVTVQDGSNSPVPANNGAINVTPGNTITIQLINLAGVKNWTCSVVGQDDRVTPPNIVINPVTNTAVFTAPVGPWSLLFKSQVNFGNDLNGVQQPTFTLLFKLAAPTLTGARLLATNETSQDSITTGWVGVVNGAVRGAGGGGFTWTTALDYDFTIQPSTNFTSDGATTVGGVVWNAINTARAGGGSPGPGQHLAFNFSGGNPGLEIIPSTSGSGVMVDGGHYGAPGLRTSLNSIVPNLAYGMPIRITAYMSFNNVGVGGGAFNGNFGIFSLDNYTGSGTTGGVTVPFMYIASKGSSDGSTLVIGTQVIVNGVANYAYDSNSYTDTVNQLAVDNFGFPILRGSSGVYGPGWPTDPAIKPRARIDLPVSDINPYVGNLTDWQIGFFAQRQNPEALTIAFSRLKVEYLGVGGSSSTGAGGGGASVSGNYNCPSTIMVGQLVALSTPDTVKPANASDSTAVPSIGVVISKPTTTTCVVQYVGECALFSGLTPNKVYFMDTNPGLISATAPSSSGSMVQAVGIAKDSTTLVLNVNNNFINL